VARFANGCIDEFVSFVLGGLDGMMCERVSGAEILHGD